MNRNHLATGLNLKKRFRDLSLNLAMTVILSTVVSVDISSLSALISIKCQVKYFVMSQFLSMDIQTIFKVFLNSTERIS